jgi:hypothetical protein
MTVPVAGASMTMGGPSVRAGVTRAVMMLAWSAPMRACVPGKRLSR